MESAGGSGDCDASPPPDMLDPGLCEERHLAGEYGEEAASWRQLAMKASEEVERLESAVSHESLRTERLRGIALTNQTCCADLEKNVESHRSHIGSLSDQINLLEHRLALRQQEVEKEEGMWNRKRADLERLLDTVRQRSAEAQIEAQRRRQEVAMQREREVRQFRSQTEQQISALQQASARQIEAEEASASRQTRRRAASSNIDTKEASKIAALRSALHRQEEETKKELREIKSEFFSEQQQLMADDASPRRRQRQARSQQLQVDVECARGMFEAQLQRCLQQRKLFHALEEEEESQSQEALRQLGQLEVEACTGELGLFLDAVSPGLDAGSEREPSLSPRMRSRASLARDRDEQTVAVVSGADLPGDDPVAEKLRSICSEMVGQHEAKLYRLHDEHQRAVRRLEAELADERQVIENQLQDHAGSARATAAAISAGSADTARRLANLRTVCERAADQEASAWRRSFVKAQEEAAEDERRYTKLRRALLAEHEQAEMFHQRVRAEEIDQRRQLIEQLALSGADASSLMDNPELLAHLLASEP